MNNIEKLKKFIVDNNLEFNTTGSGLNSDCTIISGFALHLGQTNITNIVDAIDEVIVEPSDYCDELERVFEYAESKNYGDYWKTENAKKMYNF